MNQTKNTFPFNSKLDPDKTYTAGKTFEDLIDAYGFKREEILRLAGNESTIGTSVEAIAAAEAAASDSNFYDEPMAESLIAALEAKFSAQGLGMQKLAVAVGNGMDSMIEQTLQVFCNENDSLINCPPTFQYYDFAAKRRGIEIINIEREEEKSFALNIDELINSCQTNTKLVILCNPNNPDGSVIELAEIEKLAQALESKNIMLFVDQAYIEFTDGVNDAAQIIEKYSNMIIGYTFSKVYAMAGYRVGYALMHRELQEVFLKFLTPFLVAKTSIAAAKAALRDEAHLEKIIANNNEGRQYLTEELKKLGYQVFDSQTNFILFKTDKDAEEILEKLMSQGIIIRVIKDIANSLRVTVGTPDENKRFIEALANV